MLVLQNSLAFITKIIAHILIATDFSEGSLHAATYAVRLLGATGHRYKVIHTCSLAYATMPLMIPDLRSETEEQLGEFTIRLLMRAGMHSVEQEVHFGALPDVINDLSKDAGAQMVVVGNSGKTGTFPVGNNAINVIKASRIPVLAVPSAAAIERVEHILLADDLGDVLPHHMEVLRLIATINRSEVLVVHEGMPITGSAPTWRHGTYGYALRDIKLSFHEVCGNDVVDGIERLARTKHVDLVAVIHRHMGAISRLFHPSTAQELARHADRPLLVLEDAD